MGSFYVPVMILIVVYTRIYWISHKALKQRVKQTEKNQQILNANKATPRAPYTAAPSAVVCKKRAVSVAHGGNGTLLVTTSTRTGLK